MDSEDDLVYEEDEESMEDESADEDFIDIGMEPEQSSKDHRDSEEFPYEVLTADMIVHFMVESIKEVNTVVQVIDCCPKSREISRLWFGNVAGRGWGGGRIQAQIQISWIS